MELKIQRESKKIDLMLEFHEIKFEMNFHKSHKYISYTYK